jgi:murein DD-endopeptidase MepM/ murein hydrolase activator NlpD
MDRFPAHVLMSRERRVKEGDILAPIGNAGLSTGAHVHWEIHHQAQRLDAYGERVNPQEYL